MTLYTEEEMQSALRRQATPQRMASGGQVIGGALGGAGTGAAIGSVVPGIGTAIGAVGGAIAGLVGGLLSDNGPKPPNITDPVTGLAITDAQGNVVANEQQLQQFVTSLHGVNGVQNQQAVLGQLQNVANGKGPNPAQAALNQSTGQNIESQAALMAGQRGVGDNPGLIARQIGQQGAGIQQQAVGQGATLQAQQEVGALGQEGQIAGEQVNETQNALNGAQAGALGNQGQLLGAQSAYNNSITSGQNNSNSVNGAINGQLISGLGGLANGLGGALSLGKVNPAPGTSTPGMSGIGGGMPAATGGRIEEDRVIAPNPKLAQVPKKDRMPLPSHIRGMAEIFHPDYAMACGGMLKGGGAIPGKAKVKGDSYKNDTVPIIASPGEIMLPRSVTMSKNPGEAAKRFVESLGSKYKGDEESDFKSALSRAIKGRKSK